MSRIPGPRGSGPNIPECCRLQKPCCPPRSGGGPPGASRIPGGPPGGSRIPGGPPGGSRIPGGPPGGSRIPGGPPRGSGIPGGPYRASGIPGGPSRSSGIPGGPPGGSRIAGPPGAGRPPGSRSASSGPARPEKQPPEGITRTIYAGISRPPFAAVSKTVMAGLSKPHPKGGKAMGVAISRTIFTGPSASSERKGVAVAITKQIPEPEVKPVPGLKKPSRLQRFDKNVTAELSRRRNPTPTTTTTSDTALLDAVDRLARAEAAHTFAGAVAAAEAAAATAVDPTAAEEAAAEGARCFQAELVDVVDEDVPGVKPIQIIGYVGITRPKYAAR